MTPNLQQLSDIGIIGLGTMGRNLLLNISDQGYSVAGYDRNIAEVIALAKEGRESNREHCDIHACADMQTFVSQLCRPRSVLLLVPAGSAVDVVIDELLNYLHPNDIIIDGGNSHFTDTNRRSQQLARLGIHLLGVGISGGEAGARHGPSIMVGGPQHAYARVKPIFEAMAAQIKGLPCAAWLGPGSAGHFVKMVHSGIEYAVMQLLAEAYDLMKYGINMHDEEIHKTFAAWNQGELKSYLVEITSDIFAKIDPMTKYQLINEILDIARQNGTGMWASQIAMELHVSTPTIDTAVAMRDMLTLSTQRAQANEIYQQLTGKISMASESKTERIMQLGRALYSAMIISFAQGMALLTAASIEYEYRLDNKTIAQIWRGGCIIRADLLNEICAAFNANPNLKNLLLDNKLANKLIERQQDFRTCVNSAINAGIPLSAFTASLNYFDSYRSGWSPSNLIQAQRDYFQASHLKFSSNHHDHDECEVSLPLHD